MYRPPLPESRGQTNGEPWLRGDNAKGGFEPEALGGLTAAPLWRCPGRDGLIGLVVPAADIRLVTQRLARV